MTTRGKVYGFSPAMAALVELQSIGFVKDYATSFFRGGGWPDWIFNFTNEPPNSPRIREMQEKLQKYKHPANKHGNMVIGGEMKPTKLSDFGKDMEFRQFLIQVTGILAFAYGLPAGRITAIIGAEIKTSTGSDDLANEAYWSMIRNHKDYWETLMNSQIFSKFGKVKMQFPDAHRVDKVREAQSKLQMTDYLAALQGIGVQVTMEYIQDMLGLTNEDLKSKKLLPPDPMMANNRQGFMSANELGKGPAKQGLSKEKRKQQQTSVSDKQKLGM